MGRVKDYILTFDEIAPGPVEFRELPTRDPRGLGVSLWLTLRAVLAIWGARITGRLALVHINMGDKASAVRKGVVTLLARASGAAVVLHLHAVELDSGWRKRGMLARWLISLPFRVANTNIVLGDIWRDWLVGDLHVRPERVDVLANGVPVPPFVGRDHLTPRSAVNLLFLGNLLERKGVSDLVAALAALPPGLPDWRLRFAGGGDLPHYKDVVTATGIADRVEFLGWVDKETTQRLLSEADAMILPSYHEGLPLVILEALGAGTPVITTPVGAVPQFILGERDALIVAAGDPAGLSAALARLIGDPAERQRIGDAGRTRYEQTFSLEAFRINLLAIYRDRLKIGST